MQVSQKIKYLRYMGTRKAEENKNGERCNREPKKNQG